MSQIYTAPNSDTARRAQRTAHKLGGLSHDEVLSIMRDSAQAVANELVQQGLPIQSKRFRPDVGPVQIDMIVIEEKVTKPEPAFRLQFEAEGDLGVTLTIKLLEFIKDPGDYIRGLLEQLGPMRRNVMRMRTDKRELNSRIYDALTGGANG
ncbi:hypothetical protein HLV40_07125 [Chromohalobacter salexigens]|nr:hypothetical protein [Chromohalobacter salexigens]